VKRSGLKWLPVFVLCVAYVTTATTAGAESPIPVDQRRGVEQTFLTFPEWYLVHSPAEYATFVAQHPPHDFPFMGRAGQLWSSYAAHSSNAQGCQSTNEYCRLPRPLRRK
jgi:hypothetical protein